MSTQFPLEGGVLVNSGADNTTSDTLTLNLTSRDASPIVAYQVTDNGSFTGLPWISDNLTPSDNINFTTNFTLSSPLYGERQIQVRFQDQASNISQPFSDNITRLDTTPTPTPSFHCWERQAMTTSPIQPMSVSMRVRLMMLQLLACILAKTAPHP